MRNILVAYDVNNKLILDIRKPIIQVSIHYLGHLITQYSQSLGKYSEYSDHLIILKYDYMDNQNYKKEIIKLL